VLLTQRLAKLHKDAAAEANNVVIGRTVLDVDQERAGDLPGMGGKLALYSWRPWTTTLPRQAYQRTGWVLTKPILARRLYRRTETSSASTVRNRTSFLIPDSVESHDMAPRGGVGVINP
jgi:hypothetical protein